MCHTWIKLYRKFTEWEWYADINCKVVFLHLLLTANWKPKRWQGRVIDVGEVVTSREVLAEEVGLSVQQVRTALKKLISSEVITVDTSNKFTLIRVSNFQSYQNQPTDNQVQSIENTYVDGGNDSKVNQQLTNNQPAINQQSTTPKEIKKDRIIELNNKDGGDYIYNINNIYTESAPPPSDEGKVFETYEKNIGVLSPIIVDILKDRIAAQGAALVSLAVVEAVKNGAKNIRYIERVLNAWERDNITTAASAKLRIAERSQKIASAGLPSNVEKSTFRNYPQEPNKISDFEKKMIERMMANDR